MPKIQLPELQALSEYLSRKVPNYGMFSTLKGMIENSPRDTHTAQEWQGLLKPGNMASRAGVDFPLEQEELDYSKLPDFLSQFKPNQKVSREDVLTHYMQNAPEFNMTLGSNEVPRGSSIEERMLHHAGAEPGEGDAERVTNIDPQYSDMSHAERGGGDNQSSSFSPFGSDRYSISGTSSPSFDSYHRNHFLGNDISWSRQNVLPTERIDVKNPSSYQGPTMRIIEEIQSDRNQHALKPSGRFEPTPEQSQDLQTRLRALASRYPSRNIIDAIHEPNFVDDDSPIKQDEDYKALMRTRADAQPVAGYRQPGSPSPDKLQEQIQQLTHQRLLSFDPQGRVLSEVDPDAQQQVVSLTHQLEQLKRQIPDTPFKRTQDYAGLEMRRALNNAVQAGDNSLGLASGADQFDFYNRQFRDSTKEGQAYNYDTTYPSVLKKLAKQYGTEVAPQDVYLKKSSQSQGMWPPRPMRSMNEEPTLSNYLGQVNGHDEEIPDKDEELGGLRRLIDHMTDYIPREQLGDMNDYQRNVQAAERAYNAQNDLRYRAEAGDLPGVDPQDEATDEDYLSFRNRVAAHPQYKLLEAQYQDAKNRMINNHISPAFEAYKEKYLPASMPDPLRAKTIQNVMRLPPEVIERARKAGVPIWALAGTAVGAGAAGLGASDDADASPVTDQAMDNANGSADGGSIHVDAAIRHLASGGEVIPAPDFAEGGDTGEDPKSSLTSLLNALGYLGHGVQRIGTTAAKQFYGLSKEGNPALGGRAWTEGQGGTPMGLLDSFAATPHAVSSIYNILKNTALDHTPFSTPETSDIMRQTIMPDMPSPQWSEDASNRLQALDQKVQQTTPVKAPHGYVEGGEEMLGNLLTPIPMAGAAKDANWARRALEFVAPVRPPLKRLPVDASILGGLNTAAKSGLDHMQAASQPPQPTDEEVDLHNYMRDHMAHSMLPEDYVANIPGMASGGQPDPGASPTEDDLLSQELQMRAMASKLPTYEAESVPQMGDGGQVVGLAERLAQLFEKLTAKEPAMVAPAARAPSSYATDPAALVARSEAALDPAYVQEIKRRNWTATGQLPQQNDLTDVAMANANKATGGTIHPKIQQMLAQLKAGQKPVSANYAVRAQLQDPRSYPELQPEPGGFGGGMGMGDNSALNALLARMMQHQAPPAAAPAEAPVEEHDDGGKVGKEKEGWDEIRARLKVLQNPTIQGTPGATPPPATTNNGPPVVGHADPDILNKVLQIHALQEMMGRPTNDDLQTFQQIHGTSKGYEDNKPALDQLIAQSKAEGSYDKDPPDDEVLKRGGRAKHKRKTSKTHGSMRARG